MAVPPLQTGDRLSSDEFLRRYERMPDVNNAELIAGTVLMRSPVSVPQHAVPHAEFLVWAGVFRARTPGIEIGDNGTVRLDYNSVVQPDVSLRVVAEPLAQSRIVGGLLEGAPEWIGEIAASSVSYDLHDKRDVYRRNGVQEYVVWRVLDQALDWFVLRDGQYERLPQGDDGIFRSEIFKGLWLDAAALLRRDLARVLDVLQQGLAGAEHQALVEKLAQAAGT
ncbi:MAG: Uma2 family endonuclease [Planctomycetaceae bacterium]|nr:Uma2 family endonuclease [Planctomycetaceae bacterium]